MKFLKLSLTAFLLTIFNPTSFTQEVKYHTEEVTFHNDTIVLKAKYCIPENTKKPPVVLLIAGSGPTDMDGNNFMMKNNHLKLLAESLAEDGIATLQYNKRTIPENGNKIIEKDLVFEDMVDDASYLANELKNNKRFGNVYIIGHSQGALIATLAAQQTRIKALFLVAGPGEPIHKTLVRQIGTSGEKLAKQAQIISDSLLAGYQVQKIHPMLFNVFRPDVQNFLRSWMKYDPAEELKKVKAKKIIIQGETDIQVRKEDALMLEEAVPEADLYFISDMNHIFKNAPADRQENLKTYSNPDLPVNQKLIEIIAKYIK
jgi:dipeptidyl aminopeptidase/acylaminoacyl peptidase